MAYEYDEDSEESEQPKKRSRKPKEAPPPKMTEGQWWRAAELEKKPHEILDNLARQIEDDQSSRYEAYKQYARLLDVAHDNTELLAIMREDLVQNELQATIETLHSQVFKNKVVPAVSAAGADYEEWSRARDYSRWLEGAFDQAEVWEETFPQAGMHALAYGTGAIKVGFRDCGETAHITAHAVSPRCLFVDKIESKHGRPRTLIEKSMMDRWVLYDTYKDDDEGFYGNAAERRRGIQKCTEYDDKELGMKASGRCDMLVVREAWHLPSGYNSKDGRHVIWVKGCTLVDEEFEWESFPFIWIRFGTRLDGFWGESAVKRLAPTQKNMDKLNRKIDESQDVMGVPRILVQRGNLPNKAEIEDIPGGVLEVANLNGIRDWNAQCVTPELYQAVQQAPQRMRSLLGVSDFEVEGQLPQQTREFSAPAMERWVNQGTARQALFHKQVENAVVKLAYLFMMQAEECQEMGYKLVVPAPDESHSYNSLEYLDFEAVSVDRKRLKIRVQPMSQLPQTFAGKVDAIAKLKNDAGIPLDAKTALRMLEVPDPTSASDYLVSPEEIILKNLNFMCKKGLYLPPMPFDSLDMIIGMTTEFINHYRIREDADMSRVALLAQYIDDAIALKKGLGGLDPNAPPPSTMGALGMGPPGGPPGMPPGGPPPGMPPPGLPPGMPPPGPMQGPPGAGPVPPSPIPQGPALM